MIFTFLLLLLLSLPSDDPCTPDTAITAAPVGMLVTTGGASASGNCTAPWPCYFIGYDVTFSGAAANVHHVILGPQTKLLAGGQTVFNLPNFSIACGADLSRTAKFYSDTSVLLFEVEITFLCTDCPE